MSEIKQLIERNKAFAANYPGGLQLIPKFNTMILTCIDARIDPAHFLQLDLGDALVFRNAGGRVTSEIELEIGILWNMVQKMSEGKHPGFSLALIHHNDCGFERLANPQLARMLSQNLGVEKEKIQSMSVADHEAYVLADIKRLKDSELVPNGLTVSAHLYDVHSGILSEIAAPQKLAELA